MIKLREHWRACRCAAVLLAAATYAAPTPAAQSSPAPQDIAVIYVALRGWHVDIGFAAADLKPPLKSVLAAALPIHSGGVIFAGQLWTRVLRLEKKQSISAEPISTSTQPMAHPPTASLGVLQGCGGAKPRHGDGAATHGHGAAMPSLLADRADRPYTVPGAAHHWIYGRAIHG